MQVSLVVFYRYGTIDRMIYHADEIEWCGLMDGSNSNIIFDSVIAPVKESAPELIHKCPYQKVSSLIPTNHEKIA
jgi:hypothetical protein